MPLDPAVLRELLGAIETDSLVFLCGAGLSKAAPSNLLSAAEVANSIYDRWEHIETLDPSLRNNLEALAHHFHSTGKFHSHFLPTVPWSELVGLPNAGHAALADFLICSASTAALSANFDGLIEAWASNHKVYLQAALDGQAATGTGSARPLLKIHGCMIRDRENTLWTKEQLTEPPIDGRIQSCTSWIQLHLPNKHLVVIGFWTDWGYLNDALADTFAVSPARAVTVLDLKTTAELATGAPALWKCLNDNTASFQHLQVSGAEALSELRTAFSRKWARDHLRLTSGAVGGTLANPGNAKIDSYIDSLSQESLYDLRRDAEGEPYSIAAKHKSPPTSGEQAARVRAALVEADAFPVGALLSVGGQTIRIINGGGSSVATLQRKYVTPPAIPDSDITVCAGAEDLPTPAHLISSGLGTSVIRPNPSASSRWLTTSQAMTELSLC